MTGNNLAVVSAPTGMGAGRVQGRHAGGRAFVPGASHKCSASSSAAQASVGGESALEWTSACASGNHVNSPAVLHGKHGYLILLATHPGSNAAENRRVFESIRQSFRFTR